MRAWYALFEARWRGWYGVSRRDRWAILGGQLVAPVSATRPPFWVWNAALSQLYMSSYHLAPELIPAYLDELARRRITYLWGYSSALHALAKSVSEFQEHPFVARIADLGFRPFPDGTFRVENTVFHLPMPD